VCWVVTSPWQSTSTPAQCCQPHRTHALSFRCSPMPPATRMSDPQSNHTVMWVLSRFAKGYVGLGAIYAGTNRSSLAPDMFIAAANARSHVEFLSNAWMLSSAALGHQTDASQTFRLEYLGLLAASNAVLGIAWPRHFAQAFNNAGACRTLTPRHQCFRLGSLRSIPLVHVEQSNRVGRLIRLLLSCIAHGRLIRPAIVLLGLSSHPSLHPHVESCLPVR